MDPNVILDNVSLQFPIYNVEARSLRNVIKSLGANSRMGTSSTGTTVVKGLDKVSFELNKGDRLGVIGPNGAGKTTLLKLISGIYTPTMGVITRTGTVTTLIDMGLGMDDDATGVENIYLASYLRGLPKSKVGDLVDDIVEFCDLAEFIHLPTRIYSAGMRMRLAFDISTAFVPDILLIDEVFGAGDKAFVHKSNERMEILLQAARILVFVSHINDLVRLFCNKGMFILDGCVQFLGPLDEAIEAYEQMIEEAA